MLCQTWLKADHTMDTPQKRLFRDFKCRFSPIPEATPRPPTHSSSSYESEMSQNKTGMPRKTSCLCRDRNLKLKLLSFSSDRSQHRGREGNDKE